MRVRIRFEPRDVWVGVYWTHERVPTGTLTTFFICLLPLVPIIVQVVRRGR